MAQKNKDLLIEIGTEEVPAFYLKEALALLNAAEGPVASFFKQEAIAVDSFEVYGTPRRLVFLLRGVSPRQDWQGKRINGPSKEQCYDASGKPTLALLGFIKSQGGSLRELVFETSNGRERATLPKPEKSLQEVLSNFLPHLLKSLSFPKTMRWDDSGIRFPRPIRWLLVLYGSRAIPVRMGALKASNRTYGFRFTKPVSCKTISQYFSFLKRSRIILDIHERRTEILNRMKQAVGKEIEHLPQQTVDKIFKVDERLLDEVTFLVETPTVFLGGLDPSYQNLPSEVLLAAMSKYQRLFGLSQQKGQVVFNRFIAVANGRFKTLDPIRKHYEAILEARLKDAQFFYQEDTRRKLSAEELSKIVFHKKIGTMFEKTERLIALSRFLTNRLKLQDASQEIERTAALSKADLVTQMVREFPSLQGVMGGYYALASGESSVVAQGIREHYLPRTGTDSLPDSTAGAIVSVCDKLDLIVGCFLCGEIPSSSFDPYGLRRAAGGLLRVILSKQWDLTLSELFTEACRLLSKTTGQHPTEQTRQLLSQFFKERIQALLTEQVRKDDLVEAVLEGKDFLDLSLSEISKKVNELDRMLRHERESFLSAFKVVERTRNILKSATESPSEVDIALFQEPLEKELWERYNQHKEQIQRLIGERDYYQATKAYGAAFEDLLHRFFDKVLVNSDDLSLRKNRLSLMSKINALYTDGVADLSKILMKD